MEFELSTRLPVPSKIVYNAWLNSKIHSDMTESPAEILPTVGSKYTAWNGYIHGIILELDQYSRILQTWRTKDFKEADEDSVVEIHLKDEHGGCVLSLRHSHLTNRAQEYKNGWLEYYFTPMLRYFSKL